MPGFRLKDIFLESFNAENLSQSTYANTYFCFLEIWLNGFEITKLEVNLCGHTLDSFKNFSSHCSLTSLMLLGYRTVEQLLLHCAKFSESFKAP